MSGIELSDLQRKILSESNIIWTQRIISQSGRILESCETDADIACFISECERKIINPDVDCRITWNTQVYKFDGANFAFVWFFYSDTLQSPIKVAIRLDEMDRTISVGNMDIASKKEGRKLEKHLNTPKDNTNGDE